ncbi:alpha/beta hydrolase [Fictibacillus terranigra]|uniref:Alpha/beta fold hydrolase n=1 Tax=Fictibacillus terranigra TaxID=3058424 RepID=A0ABT8E234_9BACL|nr:alpha/beta fold hydrolase [Fictibacillus sp. CENA-BCM004]MDN4071962.1 alpha/beta fold hydrolase [Fictibacillus sp. CENA-BCM004]
MEKHDCIHWKGKKLTATVHYPDSPVGKERSKQPVVVICHGFTSNRIGVDRLFVKTAQQLSKNQFVVIRFDYAGCGESEGNYGEHCFEDLIDQTHAAVSFALQLPGIDPDQITLLGHSLGGAVAVHSADRDERVKRLILWSAVGKPFEDIVKIIGQEEYSNLFIKGYVDHLGYSLTTTFMQSLKKFHPLDQLSRFTGDVLLVHGTDDKDISAHYCSEFFEKTRKRACGNSNIHLIKGANHTFSSIPHFNKLIAATTAWLTKSSSPLKVPGTGF